MRVTEARELVHILNSCTTERLRGLRDRLDRPALDVRVPSYAGKLARREDLTLRTEVWWREFLRAVRAARAQRDALRTAHTRANWYAYRHQHRYCAHIWRVVQSARAAAARA